MSDNPRKKQQGIEYLSGPAVRGEVLFDAGVELSELERSMERAEPRADSTPEMPEVTSMLPEEERATVEEADLNSDRTAVEATIDYVIGRIKTDEVSFDQEIFPIMEFQNYPDNTGKWIRKMRLPNYGGVIPFDEPVEEIRRKKKYMTDGTPTQVAKVKINTSQVPGEYFVRYIEDSNDNTAYLCIERSELSEVSDSIAVERLFEQTYQTIKDGRAVLREFLFKVNFRKDVFDEQIVRPPQKIFYRKTEVIKKE